MNRNRPLPLPAPGAVWRDLRHQLTDCLACFATVY
ncbi:hypothetical protein OJJOAM_002386 [Cupriavidus sp. H18C1]